MKNFNDFTIKSGTYSIGDSFQIQVENSIDAIGLKEIKFCKYCGSEFIVLLPDGEYRCYNCGTKFN